MFALAKRGAVAKPLQEKQCHPEAASADRLTPKDLVPPPIYKGGAVPVQRNLMWITVTF